MQLCLARQGAVMSTGRGGGWWEAPDLDSRCLPPPCLRSAFLDSPEAHHGALREAVGSRGGDAQAHTGAVLVTATRLPSAGLWPRAPDSRPLFDGQTGSTASGRHRWAHTCTRPRIPQVSLSPTSCSLNEHSFKWLSQTRLDAVPGPSVPRTGPGESNRV